MFYVEQNSQIKANMIRSCHAKKKIRSKVDQTELFHVEHKPDIEPTNRFDSVLLWYQKLNSWGFLSSHPFHETRLFYPFLEDDKKSGRRNHEV